MRRRDMRANGGVVVIELVEQERRRFPWVLANIELPATGLGPRGARVLLDGAGEIGNVMLIDLEIHHQGNCHRAYLL